MEEGVGRVHKVYAQSGEIRSGEMHHSITFDISVTKRYGQPLPSLDLTEYFPNHSRVLFGAAKNASGRWEARELVVIGEPAPEEAPKILVDYGIITQITPAGGCIDWVKYGPLRFSKESLVLNDVRDLPLPVTDFLQLGRTVRFKADVTGPRHTWRAISMTPLSHTMSARGRVTRILKDYGWITAEGYGEVYFPFSRFDQPMDPNARLPTPELLLHAEVEVTICAALPGARGQWRAVSVRLADA